MNHVYGIVKQVPTEEQQYQELEQEKKDMEFCEELSDIVIDLIRERKMCELYKIWSIGSISYNIQAVIDCDSIRGIITDRTSSQ